MVMKEVRHIIDNEILLEEVCRMLVKGKKVKLRAKGNSMRPFIHGDKDVLEISPISTHRKGDIVLAKVTDNKYVIHRIVKISNGNIMLMGDGNLFGKEICSHSDIFGLVESKIQGERKRNLTSLGSRFCALVWHMLRPIRIIISHRLI